MTINPRLWPLSLSLALVLTTSLPAHAGTEYRKAEAIHMANITDVRDEIDGDKDKSTVLDAARKVAQNCDSMMSYLNCGQKLSHSTKDRILDAAKNAKQGAESLRDSANALVRTIESGSDFKSDCEKTRSGIDQLKSRIEAFMKSVEETREWFEGERERLQEADIELAMRAIAENNAVMEAETTLFTLGQAVAAAEVTLKAKEDVHQKTSRKAMDAFKRWSEEKDPDKAEGLANEVQSAIAESRQAWAGVKEANANWEKAKTKQDEADKVRYEALDRHGKTVEEMEDAAPALRAFDKSRKDFFAEFK